MRDTRYGLTVYKDDGTATQTNDGRGDSEYTEEPEAPTHNTETSGRDIRSPHFQDRKSKGRATAAGLRKTDFLGMFVDSNLRMTTRLNTSDDN